MFQYPKNEHLTLPSVVGWGTNLNILRDPPKSLFTRRIDKVGDTQEITKWIGEGAGDRICEYINVYPRGINPMVSVSYQNYGTNGGQVRQADGRSGVNRGLKSSITNRGGQSFLPYRIARDGAFRPPILPPQDLLPLSRLPRVWTSAFSNPEFTNYAKRQGCPKNPKAIKKDIVSTCVRPTAVYNIETPLKEPYDVKYVISNPVTVTAHSGVRTIDKTQQVVKNPTKEVNYELEHYHVEASHGSNITEKALENKLNTKKYLQDPNYSEVLSNPSRIAHTTSLENLGDFDIRLKKPHYTDYRTPISSLGAENYIHDDVVLKRRAPHHTATTNKNNPHIFKSQVPQVLPQLNRNRPMTSAYAHPGLRVKDLTQDEHSERSYNRLAPRANRGGFLNRGTKPMVDHVQNNELAYIDPRRQAFNKKIWEMQQGRAQPLMESAYG